MSNFNYQKLENHLLNFFILIFMTINTIRYLKKIIMNSGLSYTIFRPSYIVMIEEGRYVPSRSFGNIFAEIIFGTLIPA